MLTLARAAASKGDAGEALPVAFPVLEAATARIRRSHVTLIAAGPGVGKTVMSTTLAVKARVPTLYFSADSDAFTVNNRVAATITGHLVETVEESYAVGASKYYEDRIIRDTNHIRWVFDPSPTLDSIDDYVDAFALTFGEYPHLIVLDNLGDIYSENSEEGHTGSQAILKFLHELGRNTDAAIVVLHHLTGAYDDGNLIPPLSALKDKVSKTPSLVLTLWNAGPGLMGVAVVKNRIGRGNPSGAYNVTLHADLSTMQLGG